MRSKFFTFFFILFSVAVGFNQNVSAQFSQRQSGTSGLPQNPVYQPASGVPNSGQKQFAYGLSTTPANVPAAALESLSQPSNYNGQAVVVGFLRLRGDDRSVRDGVAKLYRLKTTVNPPTLEEQKVFLRLDPNQVVPPRPSNLTFIVIAPGVEARNSVQPQASPMVLQVNPNTIGTANLDLVLLDGTGQPLDNRRLQMLWPQPPADTDPVRDLPDTGNTQTRLSFAPAPGTLFEAPKPIPSGWRNDGPQYTNLTNRPVRMVPPPQPNPEPSPDPRQPKTGTQMPVQQYLTTGGVSLPPYTPPPTAGERGGLKSQPPFPSQVSVQSVGKDSERKNHRP
ncbi:MAG TPA: hypothetical protein PLB32_03710 [Acidobacteriota bacterium]|nr:hypothetical protein [Acidobacteriota bacterium]